MGSGGVRPVVAVAIGAAFSRAVGSRRAGRDLGWTAGGGPRCSIETWGGGRLGTARKKLSGRWLPTVGRHPRETSVAAALVQLMVVKGAADVETVRMLLGKRGKAGEGW